MSFFNAPSPASRSTVHSPIGAAGAIRAAALMLLAVLSACDSGPSAPQVDSVRITSPEVQVAISGSLQYSAEALDRNGDPVPGQSFTWTSSAPGVATVDATGRVTGVSQGNAVITAAVGPVSGTRPVEVLPPPVETVEVSPTEFEIQRGEERTLEVTLRDAQGEIIQGRTVTFTSSNISVASVTSQGMVRGLAAGTATIRVRSEGKEATSQVTVTPGAEPIISAITPGVLREGDDAILEGERFSSVPGENEVRIGGERASVLEASATRLRIRVPTRACYPEGLIPVTLSVSGDASDPVLHPFEPPETPALAVGEFRRLRAPEDLCIRFSASNSSETYLVGLQSVTETASTRNAAVLRGRTALSGSATVDALADGVVAEAERAAPSAEGMTFHELVGPGASGGTVRPEAPERWRRHRGTEARLRGTESRILRDQLTPTGLSRAASQLRTPGLAAAAPAQAVSANVRQGDTVRVKVPDVGSSNFCQNGIDVTAVVRKVGTSSVWLEDVENPGGGFSDSQFQVLATDFDDIILPEISGYFGEPTDIDGNGRIVIVISQEVNRISQALGFVVTSDFFPGQCPASNGGEFYYARAPDPAGTVIGPDGEGRPYSVEDALADAPVLLAHETTHIIQFGRRIFLENVNFLQTVWELEGQATLAEEITGFRMLGLAPRMNLGFDVAFNAPPQVPEDWFLTGFVDLAVYYGFRSGTERSTGTPEGCGWLSRDTAGACQILSGGQLEDYTRLPYGVSWSFLRWISDHYHDRFPGGERELHRSLVENPNRGFQTLQEVVGEPVPPMLARWAASLYVDGRLPSGVGDPLLRFPSWNLRGIEERLVEPAHLRARPAGFSSFNLPMTVAAGSSAYVVISGGSRPAHSVRARSESGGLLPDHMQLWIVRLP
ncbi:MAG: Ig-like domain-containing protein [Gemmatimonadales bacterium]|nr:MAG: Ig-like domain-containing protein [Gemmatimonadales bacterium]